MMFNFGDNYSVDQLIADLFALFVKIFDFINGKDDAFEGIDFFDKIGFGGKM